MSLPWDAPMSETSEKQVKEQQNRSGYEYRNILAGGPLFLLMLL